MHIFLADDEQASIDAFRSRHRSKHIKLSTTTDLLGVEDRLSRMNHLPDLVVLDLYRTQAPSGTPEAERQNKEVTNKLGELDSFMDEVREVVNENKEPTGLNALKMIRGNPKLSRIPVLIYTRQGLALLKDDQLREVLELDANWVLKGRGEELELVQFKAAVQRKSAETRQKRREWTIAILGSIIGAVIIGAGTFLADHVF